MSGDWLDGHYPIWCEIWDTYVAAWRLLCNIDK